MTISLPQAVNAVNPPDIDDVSDYIALLKPRVMSLVVFTSLCGLLLAPGHVHPVIGFTAILAIAIGAGASGCLNMWYDRDIDAVMTRTKLRPLPQGKITPDTALAFGVFLSAASVMVMGVGVNWICAGLLAFTILFYVIIYTMWLKRWTAQNIVIGGAAGALPPVIGWAAVSGDMPLESWLLFAIIFFWTPPHFWALSLKRSQDYAIAKVPMLPLVKGDQATKQQIVVYTVFTVAITLVPYFIGMSTLVYESIAALLGVVFMGMVLSLWRDRESKAAMRVFAFSIFYLFLIFLSLTLDRMVLQ